MRTIIAGSRSFNNYALLSETMKSHQVTEVVSGGARGADRLGQRWATTNNIPVKLFIPNWSMRGKIAGPERNQLMADYAQALVAFWDGISKGTLDMIQRARAAGLVVTVIDIQEL